MLHKKDSISRLSIKSQISILLALLAGLVTATFVTNGFMNFLAGLRTGDLFSLALLITIMGVGIVLLHKLGLNLTYKEEIEFAHSREDPLHQDS